MLLSARPPDSVPSSDPILVDGVEFTVSLLSNTGSDLVSEISFEVSSRINGRVLRCFGLNATAVGTSEVTLQEENSVGELETSFEECAATFYTSHNTIT